MAINADKLDRWMADVEASVEQFNAWFIDYAPRAYQNERSAAAEAVTAALDLLDDFRDLSSKALAEHPLVIQVLRMATAPPIARDRLIGLAQVPRGVVTAMEADRLPRSLGEADLEAALDSVARVIGLLLDRQIFCWLEANRAPTERERELAIAIVGDRLCGAIADPVIRNAQEARQLAGLEGFLQRRGYRLKTHASDQPLTDMEPGTFAFRMIVVVGDEKKVRIPIDAVVQPHVLRPSRLPVLIEAKSAGDFTNTNKRRKEEATKIRQLKNMFGSDVQMLLFLCGYFDAGYLSYEAAEGLDWVWEHRIEDLLEAGI